MADEVMVATPADAAVETPTNDAQPVDTAAGVETGTDGQPQAEQSADTQQVQVPDKATRDWGRMTSTLKTLQEKTESQAAELAALRNQQDGNKSTRSVTPANPTDVHPALAGLKPDDDGEYQVGNKFYSADELIERYETKQQLAELKQLVVSDKEARAAAEEQAKLSQAQTELKQSIESTIAEMQSQMLPGVPSDKVPLVNKQVMHIFNEIITEEIGSGTELSPELLQTSVTKAWTQSRDLFGYWATAQFQDNQDYKTNNPVAPGGPPGKELGQDPLSMPKKAAANMIAAAQRAADKLAGRA